MITVAPAFTEVSEVFAKSQRSEWPFSTLAVISRVNGGLAPPC